MAALAARGPLETSLSIFLPTGPATANGPLTGAWPVLWGYSAWPRESSWSEQALSALLLSQRSWAGWLLLADRNFGVYSVARAAVAAHAQVLFRLTQARAIKLARSAGLKLVPGLDALFGWSASSHDQCPEGLVRTPVHGR